MKRFLVLGVMIILAFPISSAWAQKEVQLSIATGGDWRSILLIGQSNG